MKDKRKRRKSFDFCLELYRVGERFTPFTLYTLYYIREDIPGRLEE